MYKVKLELDFSGEDGNIYVLAAKCTHTLRLIGTKEDTIKEMNERVKGSKCYDEAVSVLREYVNLVDTSKLT